MSILVIAENNGSEISNATLTTLKAASEIGGEISVLVACARENAEKLGESAKAIEGVKEVLLAKDDIYKSPLAEDLAELIINIAKEYQYILCSSSTFGKDFMPRLAAFLDVSQISDIIKVIDKKTFIRPIYAGNALETVTTEEEIKVITVRSSSFEKASLSDGNAEIKNIKATSPKNISRFISVDATESDRPELTSAERVVSGGRGVGSKDKFSIIENFANKLNAAVGATRAAVDSGYAPNDYQVGQTGKIVAPNLYFAIGLSGAIQHLAGMKESKVIVAINNDESAPIFDIADYGLVADLFDAIPEIESKL